MDDHWSVPAYHYDPTGNYDNRRYKVNSYIQSNIKSEFISDHISDVHSTDLFSEVCCNFIRSQETSNKAFFAYVSFMASHDPRTMPNNYIDMYDIENISLPDNFMQ